MALRLISIAIFAPAVIWANLAPDPRIFQGVVWAAIVLALREFVGLTLPRRERWVVWGLGSLWSFLLLFGQRSGWIVAGHSALTCLTMLFFMGSKGEPADRFRHLTIALFGIHYVGTLLAHAGWLRVLPHGTGWVFLLLLGTWFADSGAYVVGHWIGRHKLAPVLSPAKTVEGVAGGVVASLVALLVCRLMFLPGLSWGVGVALTVAIALVGPLGDLSESLVKRAVRVKDSGQVIPGHGGFLDRVDALLFNAPLVYYVARYLESHP